MANVGASVVRCEALAAGESVDAVITRAAEEDIAAIYAYYAERDPDLAGRVSRAIISAIDGLLDFPLMGRAGKVSNTRELIMTRYPYRIVYRVVGEQVFILRGRRQASYGACAILSSRGQAAADDAPRRGLHEA